MFKFDRFHLLKLCTRHRTFCIYNNKKYVGNLSVNVYICRCSVGKEMRWIFSTRDWLFVKTFSISFVPHAPDYPADRAKKWNGFLSNRGPFCCCAFTTGMQGPDETGDIFQQVDLFSIDFVKIVNKEDPFFTSCYFFAFVNNYGNFMWSIM